MVGGRMMDGLQRTLKQYPGRKDTGRGRSAGVRCDGLISYNVFYLQSQLTCTIKASSNAGTSLHLY